MREDRGQPTDPAYTPPPRAAGHAARRPRRPSGSGRRAAERGPTQQVLREAAPAVLLRTSRGEHGTMFVLGRDQGANALPSIIVAAEHYNMIVRMVRRGGAGEAPRERADAVSRGRPQRLQRARGAAGRGSRRSRTKSS